MNIELEGTIAPTGRHHTSCEECGQEQWVNPLYTVECVCGHQFIVNCERCELFAPIEGSEYCAKCAVEIERDA